MAGSQNAAADFNSDDLDFGLQVNPWDNTNIGQKSIDKIFDNAERDRISSKRTVKTIDPLRGAPKSRYMQSLWIRRFEAFRTGIQQSLDRPFCGDDLIRFFDSVLDKMDVLFAGKPGPNVSTIVTACKLIVCYGHFKWSAKAGFSMAKHDSIRFGTWLDKAVADRRLTRGKWQQRTWIGFATLSRIVRAYLDRAIHQGTDSWDLVIARCLSIVLTSSLGARGGDLARAGGYTSGEYIKYEDIELYLDGDQALFVNIRAQFTIKYAKGKKDVHNANTVLHMRPLGGSNNCHVCPIALLLIHALRHSLVAGEDLQDVLDKALARSDRRVVWKFPTRPVLVAFDSHRCQLDRPAATRQLLHSIKKMALVAGMVDRAYVHALRLGAARDMAHLDAGVWEGSGVTTESVRQSLGHSALSMRNDVTLGYVGEISGDVYNARAQSEKIHRREPRFASSGGPETYDIVSAPVSAQEIDELIASRKDTLGKDITRKSAIQLAHDTRRRNLADLVDLEPRATQAHPTSMIPSPLPPLPRLQARVPLAAKDINARPTILTDAVHPPSDSGAENVIDPVLLDEEGLDALTSAMPDAAIGTIREKLSAIRADPDVEENLPVRLAELAEIHELDNAGSQAAEQQRVDSLDDQETSSLLLGPEPNGTVAAASPVEWIARLSKYNIVVNHNFARLWQAYCVPAEKMPTGSRFDDIFGAYSVRGGSRDDPTPLLHACGATPGCLYKAARLDLVRFHEKNCTEASATVASAGVDALTSGKGLPCPHENCRYVAMPGANQKQNLRNHIWKLHQFEPKPCQHGCDPDTIYDTYTSYEHHISAKHNTRWPVTCPFPGCTSTSTYGATTALKNHLVSAHGVSKEDAPQYYPEREAKMKWIPQTCFVDGCKSSTEFKEKWLLTKHLKNSHRMDADAAKAAIEANCESTTATPAAASSKPYVSSAKRAKSSLDASTAPTKKAKTKPTGDTI